MSRSEEKSGSGEARSSKKRGGLKRFAIGLLIVVAVILVAGYVVVRTPFFSKKLAAYVEKRTGLAVTIESTRIGWPYGLVVEGLKSKPGTAGSLAGISVRELRIDPEFDWKKRVTLDRLALTLVSSKHGWVPERFAGLGELRELEQIAALTEGFRKNTRLNIVRGTILWLDSSGRKIASVVDFDFNMEFVTTGNGRKIYYCSLTAGEVVKEDGTETRNIKADWVFTEDNRSIEIASEEQNGFRSFGSKVGAQERKKQR